MTPTPPRPPGPFDMTLEIAAPREVVWRALSTAEGLTHWFSARAEVEPGVGGRIVWDWDAAYRWPHVIDVWEPGERLLTRYDSAVDDGAGGKVPLFCDFTLSGTGGATTLRLVHSGFGAGAEFEREYDGIRQGWPIELGSLKVALERHPDTPRRLAWVRARTSLDPREAARRTLHASGLVSPSPASLAPGDAYTLRLADDLALTGEVTCIPSETGVAGTVDAPHSGYFHGHAWEGADGATQVWLWIALYGAPDSEVERIRAAAGARLEAALPEALPTGREDA